MNHSDICPDRLAWKALLRGQVAPADEQALQQHLDCCAACQSELEQISGATTWLADAVEMLQQTVAELSPCLAQVLGSAKGEDQGFPTVAERREVVINPAALLSPSSNPKLLGTLDRFEILNVLGQGGMGIVFKARDPQLERLVAIKMLAPSLCADALARKRFLREARAAAEINHPHVVTVYSVHVPVENAAENGARHRAPYFAMEFVNGPTLQRMISRQGELPLADVLRIGCQVAAALAAVHEQGLVHGDVKPANILIDGQTGRVKLADFGLARHPDDESLSRPGLITGTPAFMAPELATSGQFNHCCDLFSLGCTLFSMCAGRPPIAECDTLQTLRRLHANPPKSIRGLRDDLPNELIELVDRLRSVCAADRPKSATKVLGKLRKIRRRDRESPANSVVSRTSPA